MTINLFFVALFALLLGMYGYFTPNYPSVQESREIPKIELSNFTLYEVSKKGIDHILEGKEGKKFEEYYTVTSAKFSDNTQPLLQSIRSNYAEYRNDVINLNENVHFVREDGLEFRSNEGKYETKKSLVYVNDSFVITQNSNRIDGNNLIYNNKYDTVSAENVQIRYQLK
jgi:LPS export ABC transporter protein LptC